MKSLFLLLALCGAAIVLPAQNIMFIDFNLPYEVVVNQLKALPAEITLPTDNRPLIATYDGFEAQYFFNKNRRLCKVVCVKNYNDNKILNASVKGAIEYFKVIDPDMRSLAKEGNSKTYEANHRHSSYKMEIVRFAGEDVEVEIVAENADFPPKDKETDEPIVQSAMVSRKAN